MSGILDHGRIMLFELANGWFVKFNPRTTEAVLFTLKNNEAFLHLIFR